MFWNKKKKKEEEVPVEMIFTDQPSPVFPGLKQNENGTFSFSFDEPAAAPAPKREPKIVTDRIYVISRGNIDLKGAQDITVHAALAYPEFSENLITDSHVDLVWCSAYPDAIFGEYKLTTLLMGYIEQSEGERYMKKDSPVIKLEGNKDGDDYLILVLIHTE